MSRLGAIAVLSLLVLLAGCTTLKTPVFATEDGAIRGYDPVAYHVAGAPTKGVSDFSSVYNDETWYFASSENKALFDGDPERYAPAYGGYCAYGMSRNYVVSTDPAAWHIEDGRLYLNYSLGVRKTWLKDVPGYIERADANWSEKTRTQSFE